MRWKLCVPVLFGLLSPAVAVAWNQEALFGATVHGHRFEGVRIENADCKLKIRLSFQAPAEGYKAEIPGRNHYRFIGRLKLEGGRTVVTRHFYNDTPGARVYNDVRDTTAEGCWAKERQKLQGVDVEGCRGKGCTPEPFK
jgi:hypothetical protein